MPEPLLYLQAMGTAAIVSAVAVLAMSAARRSADASWRNSASLCGIGLGLAAGYGVLSLQSSWPPASGLDRLLMIVFPATLIIEAIAGIGSLPVAIAWLLRLGLVAIIPRILLHKSVYLTGVGDWTLWQAGLAMAGCSALLALVWSLLHALSRRSEGVSTALAVCVAISCAGATIMMAGYIKGGAAAVPLLATLLATTITANALLRRTGRATDFDAAAIIGIGVVGLFGLLFVGRFFGRISTPCALTMLLCPLLCWVSEVPPLRNRKAWLVGAFRLVLVAIPLSAVLFAAKREFDREMSPLLQRMQGTQRVAKTLAAGWEQAPISDDL